MFEQKSKNPVRELIDTAKNIAFQRGASAPGWNDIWQAFTEVSDFYPVLRDRGVITHSFHQDLQYYSQFSLKDPSDMRFGPDGEQRLSEIEKVYQDILARVDDVIEKEYSLRQQELEEDSDKREIRAEVVREYKKQLEDAVFKMIRDSEKAKEPGYLETFTFASQTLLQELADNGFLNIQNGDADIGQLQMLKRAINIKLWGSSEDLAIQILEEIDKNPIQKPSPLDVFEDLLRTTPPLYKDLLHRNGMFTSDSEMTDTLAEQFPHHFVKTLAADALGIAKRLGSREVDARHLSRALFSEPELQRHLHDLGISDLGEFRDDYFSEIFKAEDDDDTTIRVHPRVTDEFQDYIWRLSDFCAQNKGSEHTPSLLLQKLFKENDDIDKALNKAGLRRRMSRGWKKPYEEKDKSLEAEKKEGEGKKKKEKPFEIDDSTLDSLIAEYCVDFTKLASEKKFDPIIGNDTLLDQVETTLLKRGKKNPILIGEAGVGKTKVLEGYAQRVVAGKVSKKLIGSRVLSLDLHSINTSPYVGVFESRILPILKGVAERNASGRFPPIQLAIDELGNSIDAGAHSKGEGIKGMIRPYLTSGDLFVIGATTTQEYQTKIKKDSALARRFNPIAAQAPNVEETIRILEQLKNRYVRHHGIRIPSALLRKVVESAEHYVHGVNQPDKSLDLLDVACAVAVKAGSKTLGDGHVAEATSMASHIAVSYLKGDERQRYATIDTALSEVVFDQDEAVQTLSSAIRRAKAGMRSNPEAPIGNFLFVGPTGVGKTEITRALTRILFGSEDFLTRFDMSEYMEKNAVTRLIGSPPGYVNNDEGGGLINAVQSKPYSVLLYDEVEKAHTDVFNVLLAPFDNGIITDGRGQKANMRNIVNIMTTNLGAAEVMRRGQELGLNPFRDSDQWQRMARPIYEQAVTDYFKPEFLNRLDAVIYFNSLSKPTIEKLVDIQKQRTIEQVRKGHFGIELELAPQFSELAARKGYDLRYGARPLKRAWQEIVSNPLADWLLRQDEKTLKRGKKLVVTCDDLPEMDYDSMLAVAIDEMGTHDNIVDVQHRIHTKIKKSHIVVPEFQLMR